VPAESHFSGTIKPGTAVYAQVDSAKAGSDYGAVLELDEILGLPYNNIYGFFLPGYSSQVVRVSVE
jgi:hypothetical protein